MADGDGVVCVSLHRAETILREAKTAVLREKKWTDALEAGKSTVSILGLDKKIRQLGVKWMNKTYESH